MAGSTKRGLVIGMLLSDAGWKIVVGGIWDAVGWNAQQGRYVDAVVELGSGRAVAVRCWRFASDK